MSTATVGRHVDHHRSTHYVPAEPGTARAAVQNVLTAAMVSGLLAAILSVMAGVWP